MGVDAANDDPPEVFNWVEIWAARWPGQNGGALVFQPVLCASGSVDGGIVAVTVATASHGHGHGHRLHRDDQKEVVRNIHFMCAPKNPYEDTILWKCVAKGNISIWQNDPNKRVSRFWADSFSSFGSSKRTKCFKFTLGDMSSDVLKFPTTELNLEVNISHLEVTIIDISNEKNQLIRDSSDAVAVVVEDEDMGKEVIWLSRSVLSLESGYFRAMFNSDFNEKITGSYSACDFDSSHFLHFLAIIHDLDNESTRYSVHVLLQWEISMAVGRSSLAVRRP
ncbi:hypothetical protein QR680_008971 [Steinernema hermaphroditum]|uniref:BTB domain-containing protein n=1 Tax=Steinernema hermaphroditum TaxID=289476 RepID=A0AA39IKX7_9BILA|nr:hypothetical protein QR680_008971 [Steinernema hermaphroditum]